MVSSVEVAAKKRAPPKPEPETPNPAELRPFNVRLPIGLVADVDAWLEDDNKKRRLTQRTRSDLIRDLLMWAVENKPDLGGK